MVRPPRPGTVVSQPLLNAFLSCGVRVDVGRTVARLGGAGPAADTRQVLIGVKQIRLAAAHRCGSFRWAMGLTSPMQSTPAHPSAPAALDTITGRGPRQARPATDQGVEPDRLIERRADTGRITQIR
jgi:hypothetical protein